MDSRNKKSVPLYDFLEGHRVGKGGAYTHTSILQPVGSFYIPPEDTSEFFKLYKNALSKNEDLYLTEKHTDIGPIVIDLDFRFFPTEEEENQSVPPRRRYTEQDIYEIVKSYAEQLSEYISPTEPNIKIYVLEKPNPVMDRKLVKDGLHIMIPNIVTPPVFQYMLREKMLIILKEKLQHLQTKNDIKDIIDEAVLETNNWQMLGSKKPHCAPYTITQIYGFDVESGTITKEESDILDTTEYVELLSIRNKFKRTEIKFEKQIDITKYEDKIKEAKMRTHFKNSILTKTQNTKKNTNEDYQQASSLVNLLSIERADNYNDWIRVGWCLRNIDYRLLDDWIQYSKKSTKFKEGECDKIWNYMRQDGACLGMGTLHLWAKQDNLEMYNKLIDSNLRDLVRQARSGTEYDVARVIEKKYNHLFAYDSRNKLWFMFYNHKWHLTDEGLALKKLMPTDISNEFRKAITFFNMKANEENCQDKDTLDEMVKSLNSVVIKLKKAAFQSSVLTECAMLFNIEKFDEKLDSNKHLIGFENGVYDLDAMEFREGRPEDYISMTTGINYIPFDENHPCLQDIHKFLSQVLPIERVRDYVLRLLASFLHGDVREERFHVWTGSGSNGKSRCIDLFQKAFGEYCCQLPIALLTQKRTSSNSASPELARAKSKRFACLQEPGENERLNIGLMKEMTGGDKLYARGLYREGCEFKPQFKMILTCNHLPVVPSDDGGTWRRIRVVKYESRFCENPDPNKKNEYPIDTTLSSRFEDWKEIFMSLLIEYYKKNVTCKVKEPEEVLECTREYQRRSDIVADFLDNSVVKDETGFLQLGEAFNDFKNWLKEEGCLDRSMRKSDFASYIEKQYGKNIKANKLVGWKGYRLRSSIIEYNEPDEYD